MDMWILLDICQIFSDDGMRFESARLALVNLILHRDLGIQFGFLSCRGALGEPASSAMPSGL